MMMESEQRGFEIPNYTMTPNVLFECLLRDMSEAELKVMLCAVRKTFGYHKTHDPISLTQFQRMTGLSRQGVLTGIEQAVKRGYLIPVGSGARNVTIYTVRMTDVPLVHSVDQSKSLTSTSQQNRPVLVNKIDTQKKTTKEKQQKKKDSAPAAQDAQTDAPTEDVSTSKKPLPTTPKERKSSAQKKEKVRNPTFDALAQHLFSVALDDAPALAAVAPRIGKLLAFAGSRTDFVPELPRFTAWYRKHYPKASLPLDSAKFARCWCEYESARDAYQAQQPPAVPVPVDTSGMWDLAAIDEAFSGRKE